MSGMPNFVDPFARPKKSDHGVELPSSNSEKPKPNSANDIMPTPEFNIGDICTISKEVYTNRLYINKFGEHSSNMRFEIISIKRVKKGFVATIKLYNGRNDTYSRLSDETDNVDRADFVNSEAEAFLSDLVAI